MTSADVHSSASHSRRYHSTPLCLSRHLRDTARMASPYLGVDIANNYLPQRTHYWYVRCKLASDLLYGGVGEALLDTHAPLLDLGCGIGLLAHTLRAQGFTGEYLGVDNDAQKISAARSAAASASLAHVQFECIDLAREEFPAHRGSVALLDVL